MNKARGFFSIGLLLAILFVVLSFSVLGYEVRAKLGSWFEQETSTKEAQDASQFLHSVVYEVGSGVVYYRRTNDLDTLRQPLSGADAATFSVLKNPDGSPSSFAKDAHQIYFPSTYFSQTNVSIARFTTADIATFSIIGAAPSTRGMYALVFLKDKDKVFYAHINPTNGSTVIDPIPQADPVTFALLPNAARPGNAYFTKDKNHVYYIDTTTVVTIVPNADPATFGLLTSVQARANMLFWKDSKRVYYIRNGTSGAPQFGMLAADPNSLVFVYDSRGEQTSYLKDAHSVYYVQYQGAGYGGLLVDMVRGADPATFHVNADITNTETFGADSAHVYIATSTVPYADPASFVTFAPGYYKDAARVYYGTSVTSILPMQGADPATFALLSINATSNTRNTRTNISPFARDATHVYWQGKLVEGAHPDSFALLPDENGRPSNFYKDAAHVFYMSDGTITLIPGSDAATFVILDTTAELTKDTHAVYEGLRILPIDAHTFAPVTDTQGNATGYWKDASHVYYLSGSFEDLDLGLVAIPGADPATFVAMIDECTTDGYGDCIANAKDKNHSYLYGKVVTP